MNDILSYEVCRKPTYEEQIINEKKLLINREVYLDIVLSDFCQCKCRFCIGDLQDAREFLNIEKAKKQIKRAKELGVKEVLIVGGEPTISPNLFPILEYVSSLGFRKVCLTTNGMMLKNLKFTQKLLKLITTLNISVMSFDNIKQRHINNSEHSISKDDLKNIYLISKSNINKVHVRINNNVFRGNNDSVDELLKFYDLAKDICDSVKFSPLLKTDIYSIVDVVTAWVRDNILSDNEYETLYNSLISTLDYPYIVNDNTFGFVPYRMILLDVPIILNYNHRGQMAKMASCGFVNNLKLLSNGVISLSWNKNNKESVLFE